MNKQDALNRLSAIEKETEELRKIINAPNVPLNPVFIPDGCYYYIHGLGGVMPLGEKKETIYNGTSKSNRNASFRTNEAAENYAEAFKVMLELRACEGAIPHPGKDEFVWTLNVGLNSKHVYASYQNGCVFAGVFASERLADAAILKVGRDRILAARKTLLWVQ